MIVVSYPDPDYAHDRKCDHLWLLEGGTDQQDGAKARYLGHDRDIEGDDLAGRALAKLEFLGIDIEEAREALERYRNLI